MQPYSSIFGGVLSDESTESNITISQSDKDILSKVNDCKILTPTQRQEIYDIITRHPDTFAITTAEKSSKEIDDSSKESQN